MPTELSLSQLDTICQDTISAFLTGQYQLAVMLNVMYNAGLRVNEVCQYNRWQEEDDNQLSVQLEKSQSKRFLNRDDYLNEYWNFAQYPNDYDLYTASALRYSCAISSPILKFGNNSNRSPCHMFRYRYIKYLSEVLGYSVAQIKSITLQTSTTTVEIYLTDKIWQYP